LLRPIEVRHFKGSLSNLKIKPLSNGGFALACSAPTTPQGHMANPEKSQSHSTARVYNNLFARHWDAWCGETENAIWYGRLQLSEGSVWSLSSQQGLTNALAGTGLVSPVPPFGGTSDFDIGPNGLVFVAKDPELKPAASFTKSNLYYVPLESFEESPAPEPRVVKTPGLEGYSAWPRFSHCGRRVAFTRMRSRQYESDKTRLLLVPDVTKGLEAVQFYQSSDGEGKWDAKPDAVLWSRDDKQLFVTAEEHGRVKVWKLPSNPEEAKKLPVPLTKEGSIGAIALLDDASEGEGPGTLFLSSSSIIDSSYYSTLNPTTLEETLISSNTKSGKTFGLSKTQLSEIWFKGAGDYDVHAWVLKPSNFDENKTYPLCFWIHGGPQGAWMDSWSTRWNPAVFAEAGYVVVSPNPTGSSGYGMALQDGITGSWGGSPYEDLVKCFEYIQQELNFVDSSNAVAMGASYGGYMINWIQGHPLGRKFKALVCHDGVFSTLHQWTTEELFFPIHDFEGTLWENREGYERWDPARHIGEWATPQLVCSSLLPPYSFLLLQLLMWLGGLDHPLRTGLPPPRNRRPGCLQRPPA
jgi:dipeptidyl aminopeptidase/acylaminoacyl peptidase